MASHNLDDIIKENAPLLRSFVRSRVDNHAEADDIVQDTFYQLIRTISIIDNPIGQVTSWLYKVAHNLIVNHGKKHRETEMPHVLYYDDGNSFMSDLSEVMMATDNDGPDMQMLRSMVWKELDKALAELPQAQREALELTEIHGYSTRQAAEAMGVSVATFLSRKHYAVVHVRRRLKALYDELISK